MPMPIDEAVLDFVPLDEIVTDSARNLRGLLVAANQDMVLGAIARLPEGGPQRSRRTSRRSRWCSAGTNDPMGLSGPEAVVDVGARVTNIVVHRAACRSSSILLLGGDDITGAIVERLRHAGRGGRSALKRDKATLDSPVGRRLARHHAALRKFVDEVRSVITSPPARAGPLTRLALSGAARWPTASAQRPPRRCAPRSRPALQPLSLRQDGNRPGAVQFVEPLAASRSASR